MPDWAASTMRGPANFAGRKERACARELAFRMPLALIPAKAAGCASSLRYAISRRLPARAAVAFRVFDGRLQNVLSHAQSPSNDEHDRSPAPLPARSRLIPLSFPSGGGHG